MDVVIWPAKVLETRADEVIKFDAELSKLVKDMHKTMEEYKGIGLAANQVGVLSRVIVIEIPYVENDNAPEDQKEVKQDWHDKKYTFINPVITKQQGKYKYQEGCLSFPEIYETIDRAAEVWVDAVDENGKAFSVHATDLFSVCLQHEIDHIDGITFLDRMSRLKKGLNRKKMMTRGNINNIDKE